MNKVILNLLRCPSSLEKLEFKESELFSSKTSYPLFEDIPWLFKDPEYHFLSWGTKLESFIQEEETYIKYLKKLANEHPMKTTRQRLSHIHQAKDKNLKTMSKTLNIFRGHQQLAMSSSTQQVHSYFQLIFRDWCWDTEEHQVYLEFCKKNFPQNCKNVLILGCGASKINYDLSLEFPTVNFIGLDHNPFLLFTAQKIFNGDEVKLSDYTNFPKNLDSTSKLYRIKKKKQDISNHQFILGRFPELPFEAQTFDLIIAPWFFDILDTQYKFSINHTSNLLKKNGTLILFGPNNIHAPHLPQQYTGEEVDELISPLFEDFSLERQTLKYLKNPLESQNRIEEVMFVVGHGPITKKTELSPKFKQELIHFDPPFEHYKAVNQTFYHILKHIKNDMKSEDLAKKIQEEFALKQDEALYYTENFISKVLIDIKNNGN